jgi:hypothetical protein
MMRLINRGINGETGTPLADSGSKASAAEPGQGPEFFLAKAAFDDGCRNLMPDETGIALRITQGDGAILWLN